MYAVGDKVRYRKATWTIHHTVGSHGVILVLAYDGRFTARRSVLFVRLEDLAKENTT